ncbi:IclR family transcriptional regulator [Paenarthrobacter sp. Z7-10]|uniref:IclR family transcriptional regulator n=1 Tax=Paenarthrobacter sp. Z7-10 TaxID=2787635 RepID=UPI0022A993CB|nr:IclR family transcriptional regulator [Paenarthrobacter sp. Z7-10]
MAKLTNPGSAPILVLRKVSDILSCFSIESPEPTLQQIARQTGLPASTCQRLVQNMVRDGFLDRDGDRYRIGLRLVQWATPGTFGLDIVRLVRPILQELRDQTGETACLYIRDGALRTIVAVAETRHVVMRPFLIGQVMPIHAGAPGKIFLAFDPEARTALANTELTRYTEITPDNWSLLDEQAQLARTQGYYAAFGERNKDVGSIGAPVFNHTGQLAAVLGLGFPTLRVGPDDVPRLGPAVAQAAQRASAALGHANAVGSGDSANPDRVRPTTENRKGRKAASSGNP